MSGQVDVMVVGAGVAGAFAAIGLARRDLTVMLVDRAQLPRHKVCGCCLNAEAMALLRESGLDTGLDRAGAVAIDRVAVCSQGRTVSLKSHGAMALSRYALDRLLASTAEQAGCVVRGGTSAQIKKLPDRAGQPVRVICRGPGVAGTLEVDANVVLVADGLAGSCLAQVQGTKRTTARNSLRGYGTRLKPGQHDLPAGEVVMRCGAAGYVGTVVLEDGSLDIAAALRPSWVKQHGGPASAVTELAIKAGRALPSFDASRWQATAPLTGARQRLWLPGVLVLGDAAGYVEPFTGEGMAWALRGAQSVQPIAASAAAGWDDTMGVAWEHAYRQQVRKRQWRCKAFSAVLRRPALTSAAVSMVRHSPRVIRDAAFRLALPSMSRPAHPLPQPQKQISCQ